MPLISSATVLVYNSPFFTPSFYLTHTYLFEWNPLANTCILQQNRLFLFFECVCADAWLRASLFLYYISFIRHLMLFTDQPITRQLSFDPISAQQVEHFAIFFSLPSLTVISRIFFLRSLPLCLLYLSMHTVLYCFYVNWVYFCICCVRKCLAYYIAHRATCSIYSCLFWNWKKQAKKPGGLCVRKEHTVFFALFMLTKRRKRAGTHILKMSKRWLMLKTNWIGTFNQRDREYPFICFANANEQTNESNK